MHYMQNGISPWLWSFWVPNLEVEDVSIKHELGLHFGGLCRGGLSAHNPGSQEGLKRSDALIYLTLRVV